MNAILGFIVPGTVAMQDRRVTVQFADVDGHTETLVADTAEAVDGISDMVRDQMKYKICVRHGRVVMRQSETVVPDENGRTGKLSDGTVIFFPDKMDVPAHVPCEGRFYGMVVDDAFHAFGAKISVPELEKAISPGR